VIAMPRVVLCRSSSIPLSLFSCSSISSCALFGQELFDIGLDGQRFSRWAVSLNRLALLVDKELGEIPLDALKP